MIFCKNSLHKLYKYAPSFKKVIVWSVEIDEMYAKVLVLIFSIIFSIEL